MDPDIHLLVQRLRQAHPDAACALTHQDPFQLLIATILSAQCTDARVNMVTPHLFARFPDPVSMSRATQPELEEIIRTTGFFRNKAKSIRGASERLVEAYGGSVPRTMEELLTLPGVARKTANVVLGTGYGVSEGVVVDTHVYRVSRRLGLTRASDPVDVERDLMKAVPREEWIEFSHLLIFHGRRVCVARKPRCEACAVLDLCPSGPFYVAGKTPPWEGRATGRATGRVVTRPEASAKKVSRVRRKRKAGSKRPAAGTKPTMRAKQPTRAKSAVAAKRPARPKSLVRAKRPVRRRAIS
ncbi:MAG: endonuclease III [Bacteroidota bacterium]